MDGIRAGGEKDRSEKQTDLLCPFVALSFSALYCFDKDSMYCRRWQK